MQDATDGTLTHKQLRMRIAPAMGPKQVRPPKNRTRDYSPLPSNGPSARTTSDSGVPAGKKRASSPPLQELGIEYQLQLARCFRLSLPVRGLRFMLWASVKSVFSRGFDVGW